jgi:Secretory lipase
MSSSFLRHARDRALRPALVAVGVLVLLAPTAANAAPGPVPPDADAFYAAPANLAGLANGAVIRSRQVSVTGLGIPLPVRAWQLLYRSSDAHGQPVADATTLLVPAVPFIGNGPRPLLAYQTAEDSLGTICAPSFTLRAGVEKELTLMAPALLQGWAVAVSDYEGPQSQYGVGAQAGHAVLDGIRAVRSFPGGGVSGSPVGLLGYSGGALATGWAAEQQPAYAPELSLVGAAEGGTPADLDAAFGAIDGSAFAGIGFGAIVGISRGYPEVDLASVLNAAGQQLVGDIAHACVAELAARYPFRHLDEFTTVPDAVHLPRFAPVLAATRLGQATPATPIFNYHATHDELVPVASVDSLVATYCAAGVRVQTYRDQLGEHNSLAVSGAPLALSWLADRFAGKAAPSNC